MRYMRGLVLSVDSSDGETGDGSLTDQKSDAVLWLSE